MVGQTEKIDLSDIGKTEQSNENQKNKKTKSRKDLLEDFYSGVTLHGIRFVFEGHLFRRFIWFLIVISALSLSAILFFQIVRDFAAYKTVTTFTKIYNDIDDVVFPTINICPFNPISTEKLSKLPGNISSTYFFNVMNSLFIPGAVDFSDPEIQNMFRILRDHGAITYGDLATILMMNYTDLVSDAVSAFTDACSFYGEPCGANDFKLVGTWANMYCIQFNPFVKGKKPLKPKLGHYLSGLTIYLDLHQDITLDNYYPFQGVTVTINNYGSPHQVFGENKVFSVVPGQLSFLKLSSKMIKLLEEPFENHCGVKDKKIIKRAQGYSKVICFMDCILEPTYKECGCVGDEVAELVEEDTKLCTIEEMSCYYTYLTIYRETRYAYCYKGCPKACTINEYDIHATHGKIGSKSVVANIQSLPGWNKTQKETMEYIEKNFVGLHISFHDYSTLVERALPAVTWTTLFGSIGGSIGLCLGFSLITVFEFIFFFYDYITFPWTKDNQQKMTK